MELNKLIGFKLLNVDEYGMTIEKNCVQLHVDFIQSYGDCCGYTGINTLYIGSNSEPQITNVELVAEDQGDMYFDGQAVLLTFFGINGKLAEVHAHASSGSGCQYGACVTVKCDAIKLEQIIAEW